MPYSLRGGTSIGNETTTPSARRNSTTGSWSRGVAPLLAVGSAAGAGLDVPAGVADGADGADVDSAGAVVAVAAGVSSSLSQAARRSANAVSKHGSAWSRVTAASYDSLRREGQRARGGARLTQPWGAP